MEKRRIKTEAKKSRAGPVIPYIRLVELCSYVCLLMVYTQHVYTAVCLYRHNTDTPINRGVSARNTTGNSQYVLISGAYHHCPLIISKLRGRLLRAAVDTIPGSSVILMASAARAPPSTSEILCLQPLSSSVKCEYQPHDIAHCTASQY